MLTAKKSKTTKNAYMVSGNFKKGKNTQSFTKEVIAANKQNAKEYLLSIIGSKHRVKRREITIIKIEELSLDKVSDPIIKYQIGGK